MGKKLSRTFTEIVELMKSNPVYLRMGKGKLSKRFKCSPEDIIRARREAKNFTRNIPKILLFDVETAPMKAFVWSRWNQNISLDATISEWFMLCWSAKWLYSESTINCKLTSEEAINEDDSRIVKELWNLINEADIVVAYNGRRADVKWMNTRFIIHGLNPPKPYFIVDPCEIARKTFGFSSNKLDALAGYFNIPHKMDTNFQLWKDAVNGVQKAIDYMSIYCSKDVDILEEVYIIMRPWITRHPNMGNLLSSTTPRCSICASEQLELIPDKYYYTSVGRYNLYRCKSCGAVSRGRVNLNKGIQGTTSVGK